MTRTARTEPLDWRRIVALSSTANLHIVAAAAALLAISAPRTSLDPVRPESPPIVVEIVEHPPLEAPVVPVAPVVETPPPPPVTRTRRQVVEITTSAPETTFPESTVTAQPVTDGVAATSGPEVVTEPAHQEAFVAYDHAPSPHYPPLARSRGQEGEALLRVLVGIDGRPVQVRLQHSSGHSMLDRAAVNAVQRWRFHPARSDGVTREAWIVVPIRFRLDRG